MMAERQERQRVNSVDVCLGDVHVGRIMRAAGGNIFFVFDESYAEKPQRPLLSLSYQTAAGELSGHMRGYSGRVPPFFANLLPEGELRNILAKRANVAPQDELSLLCALGEDLPGAVRVAASSSANETDPSLHSHASTTGANTDALRFSLAGVQLKLSAVLKTDGSLTVPATGAGGSWIVKLPAMRMQAVPENEFVMMTLASKVGIPVPEVQLVAMENISGIPQEMQDLTGNALAVRRFDRTADGERLHMEDFAQVFGEFPESKYDGHSYANIAAVLATVAGQPSVADFVRRVVFSALIGNGDMHLKNWSLLYADPNRPDLSPAYDLVSTIPYIPNDALALGFGGSKSFSGIDRDRIEKFARVARIPFQTALDQCRDTVEETKEAWSNHEQRKLLPEKMDASVDRMIHLIARDTLGGGFRYQRRVVRNPRR